jgi:hypothetical protein
VRRFPTLSAFPLAHEVAVRVDVRPAARLDVHTSVRGLAVEYGPDGIRSNAVMPVGDQRDLQPDGVVIEVAKWEVLNAVCSAARTWLKRPACSFLPQASVCAWSRATPARDEQRASALAPSTRPLSSREQVTWVGVGGARPIVAPPAAPAVIHG